MLKAALQIDWHKIVITGFGGIMFSKLSSDTNFYAVHHFDLNKLSLAGRRILKSPKKEARPLTGRRGRFLKGPIPLNWLEKAGALPGKSLHVGICLWFLRGVSKSYEVKLSGKLLRSLGVKRNAGYRGLRNLEFAGLVSVARHRGRLPVVTILAADIDSKKT